MSKGARVPLKEAQSIADDFLLLNDDFEMSMVCGSIRRKKIDVGDLDIVVIPRSQSECKQKFPFGRSAHCGMQIQLELTDRISWGAAILYRTGSQEFNTFMRTKAKKRGFKLNEMGLWIPGKLVGATERLIFEALDMQFIEPERRSNEYHSEW